MKVDNLREWCIQLDTLPSVRSRWPLRKTNIALFWRNLLVFSFFLQFQKNNISWNKFKILPYVIKLVNNNSQIKTLAQCTTNLYFFWYHQPNDNSIIDRSH
jgi:hypothetical protein